MKPLVLSLLCFLFTSIAFCQNEVELTAEGAFFPRMTTAYRNTLTPTYGQCIFNIDRACIQCFDFGGNWRSYDFRNIRDSDGNTFVHTERVSNVDMIEMQVAGTPALTIRHNVNGKLYYDQYYDQGNMIFGGGGTGLSFNSSAWRNTSFGSVNFHALQDGNDNTAFGTQNLTLNAHGNHNTAIGTEVLELGTTIDRNTGIGIKVLENCNASDNIGIGYRTLQTITLGTKNTALGNHALEKIANYASGNLAIGYNTLKAIQTSNENFAIGNEAGASLISSSNYNVLLGHEALSSCTQGASDNIVIGRAMTMSDYNSSLFQGPLSNVAIGTVALNRSHGRYNVAVGWQALTMMESGSGNIAIGIEAMADLVSGNRNTALGFGAMKAATGSKSTGIGHGAGQFAQGSLNVFIGNEAGAFETGDQKLHIANSSSKSLISGDFSTDEVTINSIVNLTPRSTPPPSPVTGTIYMDDGTNTGGVPTLRVYINATNGWKNL